jgi:hypothetical protein
MLLSVALLGAMAAPAMADDWGLRGDLRSRYGDFGRADTREIGQREQMQRWDNRPERTGSERYVREVNLPIPFRSEISLKANPGDGREAQRQVGSVMRNEVSTPAVGRSELPALPIRAEVLMKDKASHGETRPKGGIESNASNGAQQGAFARDPLSYQQKLALCEQTGICLPLKLNANDER